MLGVELSNLLGLELKTIQSRSYRDSDYFALAIKNLIESNDYYFEKLLFKVIDLRIRSIVTLEMVNSLGWDRSVYVKNLFKSSSGAFSILEKNTDIEFPKLTLSSRKLMFHLIVILLILTAIAFVFFQNIQLVAANLSHLMFILPIFFFSLYALVLVLFPSLSKASTPPDNMTYNDLLRELIAINRDVFLVNDYDKLIKFINMVIDFEVTQK